MHNTNKNMYKIFCDWCQNQYIKRKLQSFDSQDITCLCYSNENIENSIYNGFSHYIVHLEQKSDNNKCIKMSLNLHAVSSLNAMTC